MDTRTGRPCSVERAEDGQLRCIPEADASLAYFSDPTCEAAPVAYAIACETPQRLDAEGHRPRELALVDRAG